MAIPDMAKPATASCGEPAPNLEQLGGPLDDTHNENDCSGQDRRIVRCELRGNDTAQAGDLISRGRSPVFGLCRALLAADADPSSRLECYRGDVLALTVKSVGIGAKLAIKENDRIGPKVVRYEAFSRDRVERHVRQNRKPVLPAVSIEARP